MLHHGAGIDKPDHDWVIYGVVGIHIPHLGVINLKSSEFRFAFVAGMEPHRNTTIYAHIDYTIVV